LGICLNVEPLNLYNINIFVFRQFSRADDFNGFLATGTQSVDPDAVIFLIYEITNFCQHFIKV
jgi:hypothetical protein